jgi:hypothetical protein
MLNIPLLEKKLKNLSEYTDELQPLAQTLSTEDILLDR